MMSLDADPRAKNIHRGRKKSDHVPVIGVVNDDFRSSSKTVDENTKPSVLDTSLFKTPTSCNNSFVKSASKNVKSGSKLSISGNTCLSKCKSTPVITEKHFHTPKSCKEKSMMTTPVTHLCSPSLSPKGRRHFVHHNKCSVKRFLSDSSLNGTSTPDCLDGITTQDTPQNVQPAEEETSNFVVAVRVRPLNFR